MLYSFPVPCLRLHLLTNNSNVAQKNKKNNHSGGGPSSGERIRLVMFVYMFCVNPHSHDITVFAESSRCDSFCVRNTVWVAKLKFWNIGYKKKSLQFEQLISKLLSSSYGYILSQLAWNLPLDCCSFTFVMLLLPVWGSWGLLVITLTSLALPFALMLVFSSSVFFSLSWFLLQMT